MAETKTQPIEHVEAGADADATVMTTSSLAARFEKYQHSLTRMQAVKENKLPIVWCMYMFFLCITWGFDGLAGSVVVSIAEFRKDFGTPFEGDYVVDANWQLGWLAATLFGLIFGGWVCGLVVNRWGRRIAVSVAFLFSIAGTFLQFFSKNPAQFFGGKMLTGIPIGFFVTAAPPYASEMAPMVIRGSISAGMNFAIVLGQLIGYGVMREVSKYNDDRAYRVLFATQWGFAVIGLAVLPWFPESPYFLVAHGDPDKARKNLERLYGAEYDYDGHMANIHESLAKQNMDDENQGGIVDCFAKDQWKRTLLATSMFFIQNACGNSWVIGYMSYYFQLAGMDPAKSFDTTVGLCGLMVVGNMCGWFFVDWFGRRGTALYGCTILTITLMLIGILSVIDAPGAIWAQVVFMAIWSFFYQGTVGSVGWPIATEAATSRLRAPTQALCTMMNGLSACIWSFALPYAINPDEGNLGGKIAFVFGSALAACTVFVFFMVPETKNRTFVEIDELWSRGVPPRKFKSSKIVVVTESDRKESVVHQD